MGKKREIWRGREKKENKRNRKRKQVKRREKRVGKGTQNRSIDISAYGTVWRALKSPHPMLTPITILKNFEETETCSDQGSWNEAPKTSFTQFRRK